MVGWIADDHGAWGRLTAMSDLVTGEAVSLEVRLAKLPSRALAFVLDALVLVVVAIGLLLLLTQIVPGVDEALAAALVIAMVVFVLVVVPTTIETLSRGKSVGKAALGLRVVRDDGGPIRFRHALTRALAGVFADFLVTFGVGAVLCSLLNSKDKRIGDVLAGTVVVRERIPSSGAPLPAMDPRLAAWAQSLELSRLPDGTALAARSLLARSAELAPDARERLAADLAAQISQSVSPPPPPGTTAWDYLAAVLSERRRRDALRYAEPETPPAPPGPPPADPPQPPPQPQPRQEQPAARPPADEGFAPPA